MVHFGLQPRGTKAQKSSCEFRSPRNCLFICIKADRYLRSSRENRACGGFSLMSLLSPVSPKHTPEPSMDFAEMLQIESKGSFTLHHFSHDLPRPENTEARDLDLQKSARPNPACPWHTQLFATPISFKLKKKILLNSNICSSCRNKHSFHLTVKKTETQRSGVGGQMWNLRKSGKARRS